MTLLNAEGRCVPTVDNPLLCRCCASSAARAEGRKERLSEFHPFKWRVRVGKVLYVQPRREPKSCSGHCAAIPLASPEKPSHAIHEDHCLFPPRIRSGAPCGVRIRREPGERVSCFFRKQQQDYPDSVPDCFVQDVSAIAVAVAE